MADRALENAMAKRDAIAAEINRLNGRIEELRRELAPIDEFIAAWHRFAGDGEGRDSDDQPDLVAGNMVFQVKAPRRPTNNPKKEVVAEAAREIIRERGEPVPRADLMPALRDRGLVIEGSDPDMVLSTMLWRMRDAARIVRLKGGGYWLAEEPYAPAEYDPNAASADQAEAGGSDADPAPSVEFE